MAQETGLRKHYPDFAHDLSRVKPRDIDEYYQYCVLKPAVGTTAIMQANNGTATAGTVDINYPDYPRSLLCGWADATGTALVGTVTVKGADQFGEDITETFANTSGATTNVQGTKVFGYVGTITLASTNGAAGDSITLGYGIADGTAKFGLPNKVSGSADVKRFTWVDGGATKQGTATIDSDNHAFIPAVGGVAAADDYIVTMRANYTTDDDHQCEMSNATTITNA